MRINAISPRKQILLILILAVLVRLILAWVFGAQVADLTQYHWMADIVALGDNIYKTEGLFHYTPIPMFLPAWSLQASTFLGLPFHFVVKFPMILADAGIALLLWWQARKKGQENLAFSLAMAYAFNPVSILITSFHGSYSVLPAFFAFWSYCLTSLDTGRKYYRLSALSLGMAIGLRGYPVLFLPFFLRKMNLDFRRKLAYLVLAGIPSLLTLVPFLLANFAAVWSNVFAYSGVADYGWIGVARSAWFVFAGNVDLPGGPESQMLAISKWLFLAAYLVFAAYFWWKPNRFSLLSGILATLLLFFGLYGGISSQYLVWVIPFALLAASRWGIVYTWTAAGSLVFFYLFYFPKILFGDLPVEWPEANPTVMIFRLVFTAAFWATCLGWLVGILRIPPPDPLLNEPGLVDLPHPQPLEEPA